MHLAHFASQNPKNYCPPFIPPGDLPSYIRPLFVRVFLLSRMVWRLLGYHLPYPCWVCHRICCNLPTNLGKVFLKLAILLSITAFFSKIRQRKDLVVLKYQVK